MCRQLLTYGERCKPTADLWPPTNTREKMVKYIEDRILYNNTNIIQIYVRVCFDAHYHGQKESHSRRIFGLFFMLQQDGVQMEMKSINY